MDHNNLTEIRGQRTEIEGLTPISADNKAFIHGSDDEDNAYLFQDFTQNWRPGYGNMPNFLLNFKKFTCK